MILPPPEGVEQKTGNAYVLRAFFPLAFAPRPHVYVFVDLPGNYYGRVTHPDTHQQLHGLSHALFWKVNSDLMEEQTTEIHERADVTYVRGPRLTIPIPPKLGMARIVDAAEPPEIRTIELVPHPVDL